MKNKSLAFTSIFFFAGAFLTFGLALFSRKISAPVLLVIDLLPEIALGAFLLFLSKSEVKNFLNKAKKWLSIIFVVCVINAVFLLVMHSIFMARFGRTSDPEALIRWFVKINYLDILPFGSIFSGIPSMLKGYYYPRMALTFLANALVLAGFICALVILNRGEKHAAETEAASSPVSDSPETEAASSAETYTPEKMSFAQSIKTCFKKYFSFRGRASRSEYWWFQLFVAVISSCLMASAFISLSNQNYSVYLILMIILLCFTVAIFMPAISVGVRRMHDTGNRGFLIIIPVVNIINLVLPSVEKTEYDSEYNIYPSANILGKIFVIISLVVYFAYMGSALGAVWLISQLQGL